MSEFGVRHPDGSVTVMITGHAFGSRVAAEREAATCDAGGQFGHCEDCGVDAGDGKHQVVTRAARSGGWT